MEACETTFEIGVSPLGTKAFRDGGFSVFLIHPDSPWGLIEDMIKDILEKRVLLCQRCNKKRAQIEKAQKQLDKMTGRMSLIESVMLPLAKALKKHMGAYSYDVSGPFGIGSNCSITIFQNKEDVQRTEEHPLGKSAFYLNFEVFSDYDKNYEDRSYSLQARDYRTNTGKFAANTIGAMNGGNYPLIDVSDYSLDQLIELSQAMDE